MSFSSSKLQHYFSWQIEMFYRWISVHQTCTRPCANKEICTCTFISFVNTEICTCTFISFVNTEICTCTFISCVNTEICPFISFAECEEAIFNPFCRTKNLLQSIRQRCNCTHDGEANKILKYNPFHQGRISSIADYFHRDSN